MQTFSLINTGASQDATLIQGHPCRLFGIDCMNSSSTSLAFIKFYDKASPPANTDIPVRRYMLPTGGGLVRLFDTTPLLFTTGLGFIITGAIADNDPSNAIATTVLINIDWG